MDEEITKDASPAALALAREMISQISIIGGKGIQVVGKFPSYIIYGGDSTSTDPMSTFTFNVCVDGFPGTQEVSADDAQALEE